MRSTLWPCLLVTAALIYVSYRLVELERREGAALRAQAARQQTASYPIPAQRGDILDSKGRVLAGSVRRASVRCDPTLVRDFVSDSIAAGDALGLDARELEARLRAASERGNQFVWVKRLLSNEEESAFRAAKAKHKLRAFDVEHEPKRVYPYGQMAAHLLGFVGADERALAGIEQQYDGQLSGKPGSRYWTVAVQRNQRVRRLDDRFEPPADGASVVLTIDANIQERTERHLSEAVEKFAAAWGVAVVLDAHSGEVLSMATAPSFDPTRPIAGNPSGAELARAQERLRNRAISDAYEPGSIFKPFVVGPALDEGLMRLEETFQISGPERRFGSRTVHDTHGYDVLTLAGVIIKSSNIGMSLIADRLGNDRLHEYVRRFGFGEIVGIGLPGEARGLLRPLESWNSYSTHSIAFGQEIGATPIQLAAAFAVFANDGVLFRPRVVRGVIGRDGTTLLDNSRPIAIRRVMDREVTRALREQALAEVVRTGTGTRAQLPDYTVFGKTGTAQVARTDGPGYEPNAYIGSFVCGAPVAAPRVVVLVSLFKPSKPKLYYGGTVAAPAAAAIAAETLDYLGVAPDQPVDVVRGP